MGQPGLLIVSTPQRGPADHLWHVPELRTARLILRGWQEADIAPYAAIQADPEVRRWVGDGRPIGPEAATAEVHGFSDEWRRLGCGRWAVVDLAAGQLIGNCGILHWYEATPQATPELAYGFARRAWGQGIATEAARACLAWAFQTLAAESVVGLVHPANLASRRVLAKVGMAFEGEWQGRHGPLLVHRIRRAP